MVYCNKMGVHGIGGTAGGSGLLPHTIPLMRKEVVSMSEAFSDVFIENIVKRRLTPLQIVLRILIVLAAVLLTVVLLSLTFVLYNFATIILLLVAGVIYGAYWLFISFSVEFETSFTNGELDIDKIIARKKRKRLATVKCKDAQAFGRYKESEHQQASYKTRVVACDDPQSEDVWYMVVDHNTLGRTLAVFNANEKLLNAMKTYLPKTLVFENFVKKQIG